MKLSMVFLTVILLISACAPRTRATTPAPAPTPPLATVTPAPVPADAAVPVTLEGQVGNLVAIGETVDSLLAKGALIGASFATPPSTLYILPGGENLFYVCDATNMLFQARLLFSDPANANLVTPFGLSFSSTLDELEAAGLTEVVGTDPNLRYFSYGYDDALNLIQPVGFYFTFDITQNRIIMIDVLSNCTA